MQYSFKEDFVLRVAKLLPKTGEVRLLELGSGKSEAVAEFLKKNPRVKYLGVEPSKDAHKEAIKNIGGLQNVKLKNGLAYKVPEGPAFDLSFSLSVLEHVKHLDVFINASVQGVKLGGYVIHRYDLGHALHPSSFKERFQVYLGNTFPFILPEHKFVRYLDPEEVKREMENAGAEVLGVTYHQMPNHKSLLKLLKTNNLEVKRLVEEIIDWEYKISPLLSSVNKKSRENLFPAICVWGKRIK